MPAGGLRRIALCLQYDGSAYCGWQRQPRDPSVQETLERALAQLDPDGPANVVAAGRTDSGVHAAGQVLHFDCAGPIPPHRWPAALNGRLPASIRVRSAASVAADWHACFSATYRRYRYTIYNARIPNLFLAPCSWHRYHLRLAEELVDRGFNAAPLHGDMAQVAREKSMAAFRSGKKGCPGRY